MIEQTTENTLKSVAKDNTSRAHRLLKTILRLEAHMMGNSAAVQQAISTDSLYMNVRETNLLLGTVEVALGRVVDMCGYDTSREPGKSVSQEVEIDITDLFKNLNSCSAQQPQDEEEPQVVHQPRAKRPSEIKAAAAKRAAKKAAAKK